MTDQSARDSIRETVAAYERHQNDVDDFVALHTPDTVVVNILGRRVLGREALASAMRAALASPLAKVATTLEIEDIAFARPGVAVVSLVKRVHDGREGNVPRLPAEGSLTLVLTEESGAAGGWRVALAQTTPRG